MLLQTPKTTTSGEKTREVDRWSDVKARRAGCVIAQMSKKKEKNKGPSDKEFAGAVDQVDSLPAKNASPAGCIRAESDGAPRHSPHPGTVFGTRHKDLAAMACEEDISVVRVTKPIAAKQKMTICVELCRQPARALIDSGCSALLVSRNLARQLGACIRPGPKHSFRFANDEVEKSPEKTKFQLRKGEYKVVQSCYVLGIAKDIILGIPCLSSVRVTHLDTARGEFRFTCANDQVEYEWTIEVMVVEETLKDRKRGNGRNANHRFDLPLAIKLG
jgi:hypothetical protein